MPNGIRIQMCSKCSALYDYQMFKVQGTGVVFMMVYMKKPAGFDRHAGE